MLYPPDASGSHNKPIPWLTWLGHVLVFAAMYYFAAQIGMLIPSLSKISLFWPPIGLAVAVLFRRGLHYWPGIFLGALIADYSINGPTLAVIAACGTTIAVSLMVLSLRSFKLDSRFERVRDVMVLIGTASFGTLLSAGVGTLASGFFGQCEWSLAGETFLIWWLGDMGGVILVAPVLMIQPQRIWKRLWNPKNQKGLVLSFIQTFAFCFVLYSGVLPDSRWMLPVAFIPFFLIARTAVVYRAWSALIHVLIVGIFVLLAVSRLQGPCMYLDPSIRLYTSWAYLMTATILALSLSALLAERDTVERKLKTGESTYRALVHDNPALICRFSTEGTLHFANETFRRAFDLPAIGETQASTRIDLRNPQNLYNFFSIVGLSRDTRMVSQLRDIKHPDRPVIFECSVTNKNLEVRWFRWTARAVDISSSIVVEFHAVGLDVTDQKRAEAERKSLEAQAIQTQKFEAIGVLADGIAHEFNNILTGVIGNTDLVLMLLANQSKVQPMLQDILTGAQRAAELTKQLSLFAGRTDTNPGPVNLTELVHSSQQLIHVVVARQSRLSYNLAETGAIAYADESKIRQLLMSLVSNAAESLTDPESEHEITIRTAVKYVDHDSPARQWVNGHVLTTGEYILLEVSDTGCGMTASTLTRIFEPFYTTKFPGRGLGMAAVLGIVQDHGGAIQVVSQKGRGSSVRIVLPTVGSQSNQPTPVPRSARRTLPLSVSATHRKPITH